MAFLFMGLLAACRIGPLLYLFPGRGFLLLRLILLGLATAFFYPLLQGPAEGLARAASQSSPDVWMLPLTFGRELLVGATLALCVSVPFVAARNAGLLLDVAGLGMDREESGPLSHIFLTFALCIFAMLSGPLALLKSLATSYEVIPLGVPLRVSSTPILEIVGRFFSATLLLAAPFLVGLLLAQALVVILRRLFSKNPAVPGVKRQSLPFMILVALVLYLGYQAALANLHGQFIHLPGALKDVLPRLAGPGTR